MSRGAGTMRGGRARAAALLCLWVAGALLGSGCEEPPLERYEFGGEFALTDHRGQPFELADRRGQPLLLYFGFTACPDACPTTMSRLGRVMEALPAPGIEVLFVSVDPKRDTPERLADYITAYPYRITGLTGTPAQIRDVVAQYAGHSADNPDGGVDHSLRVYLLDREGVVRHIFSHDDSAADIERVVRRLL